MQQKIIVIESDTLNGFALLNNAFLKNTIKQATHKKNFKLYILIPTY